ncbi:Translation initiation factor 2 [Candidatus Vidania fulgoroideae]|nr:Translation initiation factor 2 [Candidatus Vidania fulgoroideae]
MFSKDKKIIIGIIGNVDSGKTTLVENLKNISIKEKEPGGITQKIGLYNLELGKNKLTIIDNPGHKIFEDNLNLSFKIANIIILMISGTDKYNMYTQKILDKRDERFFYVINKIDDKNYNKENTKGILMRYNIEFSAENVFFTSVIKATNVKKIFEKILKIYLRNNLTQKKKKGFFVTNSYFERKRGIITCGISMNKDLKTNLYVIKKKNTIGKIRTIFLNGKSVKILKKKEPCMIIGIKKALKTGDKIKFTKEKIKNEIKNFTKKKSNKKYKKRKKIILISNDKNILDAAVKIIEKKKKNLIIKKRTGQILKEDIFMLENFKDIFLITFLEKEYNHERSSNFKTIYELKREMKKKEKKKISNIGIIKIVKIFKKEKNIIYGCMLLKGEINIENKILFKKEKIAIKEIKIDKMRKKNIKKTGQLFGLSLLKNKENIPLNKEIKVL